MTILGKSRGAAAVIAVAIGLAAVPANAQLAPTGLTPPAPPPATKPGGPATPPAAKPNAPAAGTAPATTPAAAPGKAGTTAAAAAPAKPADPKALMASGEKKLKANDFSGALADFEAANAAKASPEGDRYIGLSHDNLGHFAEAAVAYERFLANVPAKMKTEGDEARRRVEAIKAMPGKVHVESTPPGARVVVDPAAGTGAGGAGATGAGGASGAAGSGTAAGGAGAAPTGPTTPADLELPAGKHTLRITADDHEPMDKEIDVTYASKQDVKVDLVKKAEPVPPPPPPVVADAPAPAPTPPPPPPPEPRSKVPAYVTGAVAIVAAGVGTGFGIKALSQSSDFEERPTTKKADDGENNALVADMMFGIAITFGVTSAVLFLSSDAPQTAKNAPKSAPMQARQAPRPAAKPQPKTTVIPTPYVTSTGGGVGALVRF